MLFHPNRGGTAAGEAHARVGGYDRWTRRVFGAHPKPLQGETHRGDVGADAVHNRQHQSTPLVLGISLPAPRAMAGRSARPKPLKSVSTMWCVFSPLTLICSVAASASLSERKKWGTSSVGSSPTMSRENLPSKTK